ncbi:EAL domain-containing protein [Paraburkholderia sp. A2WS-5]|uniref:EAL and HDOD domain-containing protein n=1 Tax=unclassified Paraburkholderia TaxID=2615204 RepID=UPI003B7F2045
MSFSAADRPPMSGVEDGRRTTGTPAEPTTHSSHAYFARKPVLDRDGVLCAFELLPRVVAREGVAQEPSPDGNAAQNKALIEAFCSPTLRAALTGHRAWLDVTRELLFDDVLLRLPADRVMLELPPGIGADPELIARLAKLHGKRYRFALDHVTQADESFAKLLPYADAVKLDPRGIAPALLPKFASVLKAAGKILVALDIDTPAEHERAHALGFDRFQGYYFAKPQGTGARRVSAPRQALLGLLKLLASEPTVMQLEAELKLNPVLVMHLMRLANSGSFGLGRKVSTLREAINATGTNRIARWTQLLLYADGRKIALEDDPLLQLAATRARFMELAAALLPEAGPAEEDAAFLVGVFSFVDAVFGGPLDQTLEVLRLARPIRAAIARREGVLGRLLDVSEALERADWAAVDAVCATLAPLDVGALAALALTAAAWAGTAEHNAEAEGLERFED